MVKILKKKNKGSDKLNIILNQRLRIFNIMVFIIVLAAGYFFLISPQLKKFAAAKNSLLPDRLEQLNILDDYNQRMAELELLVNTYEATHQTELAKLDGVLPDKAQMPELIAQLDALVTQSGFRLISLEVLEDEIATSSLKPDKEKQEANQDLSGLRAVGISLVVAGGDYLNFKELIGNIEKHVRILDVVSIIFKGGLNEYSILLNTYFFEEKSL